MIEVRLYANLAFAATKVARPPQGAASSVLLVEPRPGLTVRDVIAEAGVRPEDVFVVLKNGNNSGLDSPLADGDRLALFPAVSGG